MKKFEFFGFYDYVEGENDDNYEYLSEEFSEVMRGIISDGIVADCFEEFAAELSSNEVVIKGGALFVGGRYGRNKNATTIQIPAKTSGYNRIDTIVARVDKVNRTFGIDVIQGTETTGTATAPVLTQNDSVYEFPLWDIENKTEISLADRRVTGSEEARKIAALQVDVMDLKAAVVKITDDTLITAAGGDNGYVSWDYFRAFKIPNAAVIEFSATAKNGTWLSNSSYKIFKVPSGFIPKKAFNTSLELVQNGNNAILRNGVTVDTDSWVYVLTQGNSEFTRMKGKIIIPARLLK